MSTQPGRYPRSAAKRRAAARKRTRELGKYIFAYFIIGLLVLGTVSTIFVAQTPIVTTVPTSTPAASSGLDALVTQADQAYASGNYDDAISFYNAYVGQNPANAEVYFKLGRAYVSKPTPDYVTGVEQLQRALSLNPQASFAAEAQSLLQQYQSKAAETATAFAVLAGTAVITGTLVPGATITGTAVITPPTSPLTSTAPPNQ